jgi:hypothetical protein
MPNWCRNVLTITGDKAQIKEFVATTVRNWEDKHGVPHDEPYWKMSGIHPCPPKLKNTVSGTHIDKCVFVNYWEVQSAEQDNIERAAKNEPLLPVPVSIPCENNSEEKRKALVAEYGYSNWFDWQNANWGTKWDCSSIDTGIEINKPSRFKVDFDSAWTPPVDWLEKVQEKYPKLKIKLRWNIVGDQGRGLIETNDVGELEAEIH